MYIRFDNSSAEGYSMYNSADSFVLKGIGRAADFCVYSRIFSLLTLGHLHTLIHEMGHAISYIMLSDGGKATINLSTRSCLGSTSFDEKRNSLSAVRKTYIDLAGPLADLLFSAALIVGIFALTHYVSLSQAWSWSLRGVVAIPAAIWIIGELMYAGVSTVRGDHGDFGEISKRGWSHLLPAIAALVIVLALCAIGVAFLV